MEKGLSLSQIRARVRSLREETEDGEVAAAVEASAEVAEEVAGEESASAEVPQPVVRLQAAARRIHQAKLWQDPQRWQQAERLLEQLEALVAEVEGDA
jgi:DNA-binding transcriptional MerR regulator